ncbi:uncharacterized protein [Epargyreus clarus]|uniref:uncharacterized protein isoform X1 n=2 Tax=Epargyreus clarus TaxID=520877 RepID=UPI003C2BE477
MTMRDEEDYDDSDHDYYILSISKMDLPSVLYILGGIAVFVVLLSCCCGRKSKGQVLNPPPVVVASAATQPPYPQQQYTTQYTGGPVMVTAYPAQNASMPYPTGTPYPTAAPYPTGAPYPTAGAAYPAAGAPYPTTGAPYPTAGAPYPTAPSAPDANVFYGLAPPGWNPQAMPPSYEQALKQSPYNPDMPR